MGENENPHPQFELGKVYLTLKAQEYFKSVDHSAGDLILRHAFGDWSHMPESLRNYNAQSLRTGDAIVSHFTVGDGQVIIIRTEPGGAYTTVMLPEDA
ncbi:MAG: hypothetical protein RIF32_15260 [Leptospirales bacterium]|jgi:3'-phosphoadenosine 5'-phosphosulfate (PAPS) 3'-phosphatase